MGPGGDGLPPPTAGTRRGVYLVDEPCDLGGTLLSMGTMGRTVREHELVIATPQGSVLILGCAYPGVERTASHAAEISGVKLRLVRGGFPLGGIPSPRTREAAARLANAEDSGAPGHCTGKESTTTSSYG